MTRFAVGPLAALLLSGLSHCVAAEGPLPEPLTLEDALAHARVDLPAVELALAAREASAAAVGEVNPCRACDWT